MKSVKLFLGTILVSALVVLTSSTVFAKIKLEQKTLTQTSITVKWSISGGGKNSGTVNGYELRFLKYADYTADGGAAALDAQTPVKLAPEAADYLLSDLLPGTKYMVKLTCLSTDKKGRAASEDEKLEAYTAPGKVTGLKKGKWDNEALKTSFSWAKQDACSYEWQVLKNDNTEFASGKTESETSASVSDLSARMCYMVHVRATVKDPASHQPVYGDWSDYQYLFGQPVVYKVKRGSGKLSVYWHKIAGVTTYKVYMSTRQHSAYKLVKKVSASKRACVTIRKFRGSSISKKRAYFVYVVANKTAGSKTYKNKTVYTWKVAKRSNTITRMAK